MRVTAPFVQSYALIIGRGGEGLGRFSMAFKQGRRSARAYSSRNVFTGSTRVAR